MRFNKAPAMFVGIPLLLMGGLLIFGIAGRALSLWSGSLFWRSTDCLMISSVVRTEEPAAAEAGGEEGEEIQEGSGTHQLFVEYEYTVNGKTYRSRRFSPWKMLDGPDWIAQSQDAEGLRPLYEKYRKGKRVKCLVSPTYPSEAMLTNEMSAAAVMVVFFGVMLALSGLAVGFL